MLGDAALSNVIRSLSICTDSVQLGKGRRSVNGIAALRLDWGQLGIFRCRSCYWYWLVK